MLGASQMSRAFTGSALTVVLALGLSACTGTVVGGGTPYAGYDRDTVNYLVSRGPIRVRTVGQAGDLTPLGTLQAVTERFRLPGEFAPATFTEATDEQARDGFHVTFVFNPAVNPDVRRVCGSDPGAIATRPEAGELRVVAAYCYRDEALNRVNARTPTVDPKSSEFGAFLDSVSLALFPVREPGINIDKRRRSE